ncbi:MAG: D-glucuronyl C5-epimerase family protein [Clostridium sp.]|nr:D-glucuronyl C5-epimerase family protein [Clostridium sp.]
MKISEMIEAYGGMIFGKQDYWHPNMIACENIVKDTIGCYYVDTRPKHIYPGKFDEKNIPLLNYNGKDEYFPVTIAQYALGNFDKYIDTNDYKYFQVCSNCARWFVDNLQEIKPGVYGYINDYDNEVYGISKPWLSALGQGQAMSVLARCYSVEKKEEYLECCKKLLKSFIVKSKDKGVLAYLNGEMFYEEYPSAQPSFVLNGFIFSLWGLLDFYIVGNNEEAKKLYEIGLNTLKNNLHNYNIGKINWSKYDLYTYKVTNITSIFYHKLHIEQLKAMYTLTDDDIYKHYYTKWEKAKNNKLIYMIATIYKINHKLSVRKESSYVPSLNKEE